GLVERDGENERLFPAVALGAGDVRDAEGRRHVVVDDGAGAGRTAEGSAAGGAEVESEGLVRLDHGVAVDQDGDGLRGLAGGEVAGPGADGDGAVGGDIDVEGVAQGTGGGRDGAEVDAAQEGAGGVEVRDDLGPVDGEEVAVGVDGDAAVVVGRQGHGAELGQ